MEKQFPLALTVLTAIAGSPEFLSAQGHGELELIRYNLPIAQFSESVCGVIGATRQHASAGFLKESPGLIRETRGFSNIEASGKEEVVQFLYRRINQLEAKLMQESSKKIEAGIQTLRDLIRKLVGEDSVKILSASEHAGFMIEGLISKNEKGRVYLNEDGQSYRIEFYEDNKKISEDIIDPETGELKMENVFFAEGGIKRETCFKEKGVLRERGFREDGTLTHIFLEGTLNFYDSEGKNTVGKIEAFAPKISSLENYVKQVQQVIKTKEQFFTFEWFFVNYDDKSELSEKIRQYGRKFLGINVLEESIEQTYGIEIESENPVENDNPKVTAGRHSLGILELELNELDRVLGLYPLPFLKRAGAKRIFLVSNLYHRELGDLTGLHWKGGENVVLENVKKSGFHEIFHLADETDGGYNRGNPKWCEKTEKKACFDEQIDERQAQVAEDLFMYYHEKMVEAEGNPVLAAEIEMIKAFYYKMSDGLMDAKFWEDLAAEVWIDRGYWSQR